MQHLTNLSKGVRYAYGQFNNLLRQPKTHPDPILYEYIIEVPEYQKILSVYCKSLNISQTKVNIIHSNRLEELKIKLESLPKNKKQSFIIFKLPEGNYIFAHHPIFPTNTNHSRIRNLITLHNKLNNTKLFCWANFM